MAPPHWLSRVGSAPVSRSQASAAQQNTQFAVAEMATEIDVTHAYVQAAVRAHNDGTLSAVDAAKAKWCATEMHKRMVDRCVQFSAARAT